MKENHQQLVESLMSTSTRVFDGQISGDWDADIFHDDYGYFGVFTSYPCQVHYVLCFARITDEEYQQILGNLKAINSDEMMGEYLIKAFQQINERNREKALRHLHSIINISYHEKEEMTFRDACSKYSKLSVAAFNRASIELERGNIYRHIVFDEIASNYWDESLAELDCAILSGEFRNRQPAH